MHLAQKNLRWLILLAGILACGLFGAGCSDGQAVRETAGRATASTQPDALTLPELEAADLGNEPLKVVATTSIIGDVVSQVGGENIALATLLGPGQDPHSYEPAARDLTAVAGADVIFVNGWDLEEGLVANLASIAEGAPIVPISANIKPLAFGDAEGDSTADPHVWFSVPNVVQWVENTEHVLSDLDPANSEVYANNSAAYLLELEELQAYAASTLAEIPEEKRFLVTNHNSFGYFAEEYGFEILGTVIPAASTLAEPSAGDLAVLIEEMAAHGVCTLFTETAVSDTLARTVAGELQGCDEVRVLRLYAGSLGPAGSAAGTYIDMFRTNVETIVSGLQ